MKILIELPDFLIGCLPEVKNGSLISSMILNAVKDGTVVEDTSE